MRSVVAIWMAAAPLYAPLLSAQTAADAPARLININECGPVYPAESLAAKEEGTALLRVHVTAAGELRGLSLLRSSGHQRLDQATLNALGLCRYAPARREGTPVEASFNVEYVWRLDSPPSRLACRPEYPTESIRTEEQGTTTLRFRISADGNAQDVQVAKSSGHPRLDAASIEALKRCTFRVDATTSPNQTTVEFVWKLENADSAAPAVQVGPLTPEPYVPKL